MKWLALVVLWAAAACGESVIVASELVSDAGAAPSDCSPESTRAEPAPVVFELVVDTSGSMGDDLPDQRGTKWTVTRDALLEAIAALPEQTSLGVVFYPDVPMDSPTCFNRDADVNIDVLGPASSEQRRRIADAFDDQSPEGAAPTHDAYDYAFDQLRSSQAEGRRFMLLIADNYPTYEIGCRDDGPIDAVPLIMASGEALASGVSTFVIGLPGGELARSTLSRMAAAGGTAPGCSSHMGPNYCHFDLSDNEQDLADTIERTLGSITTAALSCNYSVPAPASGPPDSDQLQVSFNPESGPAEALQQSPAGPCDEGWQHSADGSTVVLCQRTCERLRQANARIEFRSECPAQSP